jgi:transposase-like protein
MECTNCNKTCQKWGRQKNGTQRFYCTGCKKAWQGSYRYLACKTDNVSIISLLKESASIRGIGRVLRIAKNTVMSRIKKIAASITNPRYPCAGKASNWTNCGRSWAARKQNMGSIRPLPGNQRSGGLCRGQAEQTDAGAYHRQPFAVGSRCHQNR